MPVFPSQEQIAQWIYEADKFPVEKSWQELKETEKDILKHCHNLKSTEWATLWRYRKIAGHVIKKIDLADIQQEIMKLKTEVYRLRFLTHTFNSNDKYTCIKCGLTMLEIKKTGEVNDCRTNIQEAAKRKGNNAPESGS
ncbi:MAG: hypothetical protein V4721_00600 [Bacteroidota bacterium]